MYVCPECGHTSSKAGFCDQHGVRLESAGAEPLLGQMVGSYRVARELGRGGMGNVFLAVHPAIGSRVAIKVLSPECASRPGLVERFFAEARAVNLIRHENIVSVLDLAWLPDRRPYIVMEYLDGRTLGAWLREMGALPLGTATQVVIAILEALSAAHAKGIVHRDLKPDNVYVTATGRIKVLDFGIAKLRPDVGLLSDETRTGAVVGTPHYMAPEQARGLPVDRRADLYSVGVIAYELCTGSRPFDAASLYDLLRLHVEQPAPSPRARRPDLPPSLEAPILRSLEKEPARRFETAAEMIAAFQQGSVTLPSESWRSLGTGAAGGVGGHGSSGARPLRRARR